MKRFPIVFFVYVLTLLLGLAGHISAQRPKPVPKRVVVMGTTTTVEVDGKTGTSTAANYTPLQQRRLDSFEKVWSTLNENYFDRSFNGLDWNSIRAEYRPRVIAAKADPEFHRLLQEMITRLGKSHFSIILPEYLDTIAAAKRKARRHERELAAGKKTAAGDDHEPESGEETPFDDEDAQFGIGVDLRMIDDKFVVTSVDKQSGASIAGIKPGYVIEKINGVSLADMVARVAIYSGIDRNYLRHLPAEIIAWFLNGERDTYVQLACLTEDDKPQEFRVPRLALSGNMISLGQNFPEQFLQFRTESLSDDIGYVKFNVFVLPVISKFCESLSQFSGKKSLIIDLRGNRGGLIATIVGLTGMLSEKTTMLGNSTYRNGREPLIAQSLKKHFSGRLVFLVDNASISAAEMFAAGLQEDKRAIIVGERTAGEALPSVSLKLATGAVFMYPMANFTTFRGRSLEGNGVEPDVAVKLDRSALLRGTDTQLEKAIAVAKGEWKETAAADLNEDAPPPPMAMPAPAAKPTPKPVPAVNSGLTSIAGNPPATRSITAGNTKDARAQQIIDDFAARIGGRDAFKKLAGYQATGKATILLRGSETEVDIRAYRQFPAKFSLVMASSAVGEIRQVYSGAGGFLQTDYGLEQKMPASMSADRGDIFAQIYTVLDDSGWSSLKYEGEFEMKGRKMQVITAKTVAGSTVGLSFDSTTKLLDTYTPAFGIYSFSDFRQVNGIILPFRLLAERSMNIQLDAVTLDPTLEPAIFERKEMCFDKPIK